MRGHCKHKCGRMAVMAVAAIGFGSLAVMLLWNWLTPRLFGWLEINYLQAMGLLLLSRILIGGGHCMRGRCHGSNACMSPEERERVEAGMKSKWCCGSSEKVSNSDKIEKS